MSTVAPPSFPATTGDTNQDQGRLGASPRLLPCRVDHTYRDISQVTAAGLPRKKNKFVSNFLSKLHQMLSTEEFVHVSLYWLS